jgi:translation elongation factor P/translation initiation factor 5A
MKLKSLLTNSGAEVVYKADDKMEQIVLDHKECTYSYFADPMYVFMDTEYNQYDIEAENMGDAIQYLEDGMPAEVVFGGLTPSFVGLMQVNLKIPNLQPGTYPLVVTVNGEKSNAAMITVQ